MPGTGPGMTTQVWSVMTHSSAFSRHETPELYQMVRPRRRDATLKKGRDATLKRARGMPVLTAPAASRAKWK
jgi:hypothetical protein